MSENSEAERLADLLQDECGVDGYVHDEAAAELRRLHAENALLASATDKLRILHSEERMELLRQRDLATAQRHALLEALKEAAEALEVAADNGGVNFYQYAKEARAAIKAVEEGK